MLTAMYVGSILVHVMTPAMKNYYKLEKRWAQGEVVAPGHMQIMCVLFICLFVFAVIL